MEDLRFLLMSCLIVLSASLSAQNNHPYEFVSPKPATIMVSKETNIILKHPAHIDKATLSNGLVVVEGSKSGVHTGELILSDDHKTIVFNPDKAFAGNEDVKVILGDGIRTLTGSELPEYSFNFSTAPAGIAQLRSTSFDESNSREDIQHPVAFQNNANDATLPAPLITINSIDNPSPGYIFMATWDRNVPAKYGNFIFILDKSGAIVDSVRVKGAPYDFQVQPNGLLTYALGDFSSNVPLPGEELQHIVRDSTLAVVDSFTMKNGYITDFHEFKMLPNGHVMLMSYHTILYDMSTIVEGGKTDASLVINILQEQDRDKNVVFEWRNIDYIPITDTDLDLTDQRINYGTLNAFDIDDDGNILASFRNHSEIMKISRTTGELMWRMGGPRGEFTFVGEHEENAPYYYARQHNIRRRPNGNITLFDNGQFHKPPYSRAVEYDLDEVNKVATMVSEWRYPDENIFCATAGNAETLSNGGWFIGYGVPSPQFLMRNAVEVHPDGSIALEVSLPKGVLAYRAYKFPWKETVSKPSFTHFEVKEGNLYSFNNASISTGVEIEYTSLEAAVYNQSTITRIPYGPVQPEFDESSIAVSPVSIIYEGSGISSQTADLYVDLAVYPEINNPDSVVAYHRIFPGQGLFIPVPTSYDSLENRLSVTLDNLGEIVFGVTVSNTENNIPIQYEPLNQQKLILQDSVTIRWTGKGLYDSFNIQVSTDSTFNTILYDEYTNLSNISIGELTNNTRYFWRVNSVLSAQTSQWSEVWNFEITDPYIRTVSPNGGETWTSGDTVIIRWDTNIFENVRIDLMQDQNLLLSIDTIPGINQAYTWIMPADLQAGENYKVQVISELNPSVIGLSAEVFTILSTNTGAFESENIIHEGYGLEQNFPNPFQTITKISYSIKESNFVTLKVYNLLGKEVHTLISETQERGIYSIDFAVDELPDGVYFYKLQAGNDFIEIKKMLLMRY